MNPDVVESIFWTNTAKESFQKIIDWLIKEWSEKDINKLIDRTAEMFKNDFFVNHLWFLWQQQWRRSVQL
jgi:hypothetical protein